jgi:hypothetical protein
MEMQELTFKKEKETKNTIRYQEVVEDGKAAVVTTMYIQKSATSGTPPETLSVTIGVPVTN